MYVSFCKESKNVRTKAIQKQQSILTQYYYNNQIRFEKTTNK
jgi:hypothetical protein